jgi:CDP-diacylglycerol pyrophosphatase
MKKPLILFLVSLVILIIAGIVYTKYCKSKLDGCKKVIQNDADNEYPQKGIDW